MSALIAHIDTTTRRIVTFFTEATPEVTHNMLSFPTAYITVADTNLTATITGYFNSISAGKIPITNLYFSKDFTSIETLPNIAVLKQKKIEDLYRICDINCNSGLISSVLGTSYVYPTRLLDQQNVHAAVTASLNPSLPDDWTIVVWCAPNNGNPIWVLKEHTKKQVQQLGEDYIRFIELQRVTLRNLVNTVSAIDEAPVQKNVIAVNTVHWA